MKLIISAALAASLFGQTVIYHPHDGDTVFVYDNIAHQQHRGRILHIDAPEISALGRWPTQPFAIESRDKLKDMLWTANPKATVRARDKYGRLLIEIDPSAIQRMMVLSGSAWATDKTYRAEMLAAKAAKRGLWGEACIIKPSDWRKGKRCPTTSK